MLEKGLNILCHKYFDLRKYKGVFMVKYFLLLLVVYIFIGCDKKDDRAKEITVGMTYDEVESIIGKPSQIERGTRELDFESKVIDILDSSAAAGYEGILIKKYFPNDSAKQLRSKPNVESFGQLIYVTWRYSNKNENSYFYVLERKNVYSKIPKRVQRYFLNGTRVSKKEYEFEEWRQRVQLQTMEVKKHTDFGIDSIKVKVGIDTIRINYQVSKYYCVVFDASSGRVVKSEYVPYYVSEM